MPYKLIVWIEGDNVLKMFSNITKSMWVRWRCRVYACVAIPIKMLLQTSQASNVAGTPRKIIVANQADKTIVTRLNCLRIWYRLSSIQFLRWVLRIQLISMTLLGAQVSLVCMLISAASNWKVFPIGFWGYFLHNISNGISVDYFSLT